MGAITPAPFADVEGMAAVDKDIVKPFVQACQAEHLEHGQEPIQVPGRDDGRPGALGAPPRPGPARRRAVRRRRPPGAPTDHRGATAGANGHASQG